MLPLAKYSYIRIFALSYVMVKKSKNSVLNIMVSMLEQSFRTLV